MFRSILLNPFSNALMFQLWLSIQYRGLRLRTRRDETRRDNRGPRRDGGPRSTIHIHLASIKSMMSNDFTEEKRLFLFCDALVAIFLTIYLRLHHLPFLPFPLHVSFHPFLPFPLHFTRPFFPFFPFPFFPFPSIPTNCALITIKQPS
jgi:hypothetical protein